MPTIERSISLNVPVETAYRYLITPTHLPEFCLNLDAVTEIEHVKGCCTCFQWNYRMYGVHFEGRAEILDTQHPYRADLRFWGGVLGNAVWTTQQLDDGVLITVTVDYVLPAPLTRKHSEDEIIRHNEHAVEKMRDYLKALLKAEMSVQLPG